ncbi:MAG: hypothetical protein HY366_01485, partial [Candidatus Aenigmarchaeota archaeon]|nr:hypothetical protein [Candidatus Aenigmarchaeota archaeon]
PDGRSARTLCPNTPCEVGVGGVKILIHRTTPAALAKITGAAEPEKAALRLLRARHLEPQRFILGDPLLLREVPDILCIATGAPFTTNYKGVTVVSPTIEQAYVVDLKTRAVRAV